MFSQPSNRATIPEQGVFTVRKVTCSGRFTPENIRTIFLSIDRPTQNILEPGSAQQNNVCLPVISSARGQVKSWICNTHIQGVPQKNSIFFIYYFRDFACKSRVRHNYISSSHYSAFLNQEFIKVKRFAGLQSWLWIQCHSFDYFAI